MPQRVRLEDIINKTVFMDLAAEARPELTAFFESGVVVRDPLADALAAADGQDGVLPFWLDLDPDKEPNYSSDQEDEATPDKVVQSEQRTRKSHLNNGWSAMDLARELQMGTDAMRHIRNRLDTWWVRQWQRRVIATTRGLWAANVAGNLTTHGVAGDMTLDISIEDGAAATSANRFSRSAFTAVNFTMGDHVDDIRAILVHSVIYKAMIDNDDIEFIRDSKGEMTIPTYMGKRVIVDDMCPVIPGTTSGFRYVSTLYGAAAFAYGEAHPIVPFEVERNPASGHGGGNETLWSRKTWLIHPAGHSNTGAVKTGNAGSQTLADLRNATNWTRTHFRKNVPLAFLITNG
jgi:hypothetical protein